MKNWKHYDNSSMSIQIKFKKEDCDSDDTDVNGNNNKFVSPESETSQCHGQMTSQDKHLPENQTFENNLHIKREDARKLPPLRISKARFSSVPETNKDNNITSSLYHNLKASKLAKDQSNFKTNDKCKNIFSDFSMSHFSETRHARTDISVKIGANKQREAKDKQLQKYPKLQVSLTLNENKTEKDLLSIKENGIVHSVTHDNVNGNPQSLSICVCEYDTNDDSSELKSKSPNVKLTDSDNFLCNCSKEDDQNAGSLIPQLSPITFHRGDNSMLPSPLYSSQPPVLTPISEEFTTRIEDQKSCFTVKTETDTQELSTAGASKQKSSSSLTPVHISAIKKTLKRTTCHALESICAEKIICDFKDKNVLLQRPREILPNEGEQNVSEALNRQTLHLKTLDNAIENIAIHPKANPKELLTLSTKNKATTRARKKHNVGDGNTVKNATESNICSVNSKVRKRNSKSRDKKEIGIKYFTGSDENNQFGVQTERLASVDQALMHSEVETASRQFELILPSQDLTLTSHIDSCSADDTVAESVIESQCVATSVASSTNMENHNSSTSQEQACRVQCVENPEIKHSSSLKPVSAIPTATHKSERDKLSLVINSLPSNGDLQPCLMDQDSKTYYSVLQNPEQSIPSSSSCSDVSGLKTDSMRSVPYENTTGSQEHDSQSTEALCMKEVFTPSQSCVVTLEGGSEQPLHAMLNPPPIANTQMCTAFENDLFLDMNINNDKPVSSETPDDSPINSLQHEKCSDFHTHDATKRQSSGYDCSGSLKVFRDGLCSEGQAVSSTFQSKYIEAISRDFKHHLETLFLPRNYQIADTTGSVDLSPQASTLGADRISPGDGNHVTLSSTDAFNSTVRTLPSQRAVARASSADARHFRVSASNESTLRSLPASATTVIASSSDALASLTSSSTSRLFPQKVNIPDSSISRTSTKLDPGAVKNMSLHIIHHSGKRNICLPKETTQEADQISSAHPAQPTSMAMTSHVADVNNTSQNVHKSKRNSVISMANSYLGKATDSQLHMPSSDGMQTRMHSLYQESVPTRLSYSNNQQAHQPDKMEYSESIETAKHAHSEHVLTKLKFDHMLAKCASLSPNHRENPRMPYVTSSSSMNYHSASSGITNSTTVPHTQQLLRSEDQRVPFELTSDPKPRRSLDNNNESIHIPGSDMANQDRYNLRTSELIKSANFSHLVQGRSDKEDGIGKLSSDSLDQDISSPATLNEAEDPSQTGEFSTEPLDLSLPKEKKYPNILADVTSQHLHSEREMFASNVDTSLCQPNMSDSEYTTVSPHANVHMSVSSTSCEVVSSIQTPCQNKDILALDNRSLTLPQNCPVNSLPTTVSSTTLQGLYHRSPLLETALLHNIVPRMKDPHPFNSVVPDCLMTRPSPSDQCECKRVTNKQTDYKASHVSQSASLEPSSSPTAINSAVPFDRHTSLVSSATVFSPSVYQCSQPELPLISNTEVMKHMGYDSSITSDQHTSATVFSPSVYQCSQPAVPLMSNTEVMKHMGYDSSIPSDQHISATVFSPSVYQCSQPAVPLISNTEVMKHMGYDSSITSDQHISATATSQGTHTSRFTNHQQRANLPSHYSRTVSTSSYPSNNVIATVGAATSKVVPLPIQDFFTRTPKENTYSALLMAKITNMNKQNSGFQKVTELLRSCESQNSAHRNALEIGNHLQKNLVIDLTDSDDDCKLLPGSPQEYHDKDSAAEHLRVNSNDHDSLPVLKIVDSCASGIVSPLKENTGDLHYVDLSVCDGNVSKLQNNQKDNIYLQNTPFINTSNNSLTGVPDHMTDVENIEPLHNQEKHVTHKNEPCYENMSTTEGGVHTKIFSTSVIFRNDKPAVSTDSDAGYSNSYTISDNVDKALRTINSRTFSSSALDLKMDLPGKELMAKKLKSAMSMRIHPEELTQTALPLTSVYKEGAYVDAQKSPVRGFEERIQSSTSINVHDNSTQRAAATLLELSANPIYNPYLISPENSGDFQEKVYQIHPVLSNHEDNTWDTIQDGENNSLGFKSNQSYNVAGTKAHKARSCRRVGRPPKDQYNTSDSDALVTGKSISSSLVTPISVENNTSLLTQAAVSDTKLVHSVTPYSFSNVIVRPPNVAYETQTPFVSVRSDSLPCMFNFNYEFPDQNQFVREVQNRTMMAMGNQPLRGDHVSKCQNGNVLENSRHTTNSNPQFKGSSFARVASKTASDTMISGTAIQTMTVNTGTHLSNGLQVVHNKKTHTFHANSPTTNISDLESVVRSQCDSRCSVTHQQSPNPFVENSLQPASLGSELIVNNNAVFTEAKKCTSDPGKHSRAQKRKYPNLNSQEEETAQSHTVPSETVPNVGFPLSCLANTLMLADDLTKQENTISKSSKKKRTLQGRVKKRNNKRNKNSKIPHHQNSNEQGTNMNNRNPHDTQKNMCQSKKDTKPGEVNFQDDEQTIQYGLQDLQMTEHLENGSQKTCLPVSSTSHGLTLSDRQLWNTTVASDGMSNMEKMEHQKEMEVTSLLALMMCNKYKGQV